MAYDPLADRPVADREIREHTHTHTSTTRSSGGLAVIIAAIILVVAGLAYVMFSGDSGSVTDGVNVTVEDSAPAVDGAAATAPDAAAPVADDAPPADAGAGEQTAPVAAD